MIQTVLFSNRTLFLSSVSLTSFVQNLVDDTKENTDWNLKDNFSEFVGIILGFSRFKSSADGYRECVL